MFVENKIREVLKEKKIRPIELAGMADMSDSYLSRIMSGAIANPTVVTAFKISNALDVTIEEVFILADVPKRS